MDVRIERFWPVWRAWCGAGRWAAAVAAGLLLAWCASLAAPDFDRAQQLAQQRYGARAADTVQAWRRLIEELRGASEAEQVEKVNTFFNRRVLFEDDIVVWQQPDYWASPLEFMGRGSGDCEDFSIAKYVTLRHLGVADAKLRITYVRARIGSTTTIAHMVLGYYPQPTDEPLIMDNLIGSVRPASQRGDLSPLYSFNGAGLWVGGATTSSADPTVRLSRWRDVLERMQQEGVAP